MASRFGARGRATTGLASCCFRPRPPQQSLTIHRLGNQPVERGWGCRRWAVAGGGASLVPNQARVVVDDRPVLLRGGVESAELLGLSDKLGAVSSP
jgi:hypothetical protein